MLKFIDKNVVRANVAFEPTANEADVRVTRRRTRAAVARVRALTPDACSQEQAEAQRSARVTMAKRALDLPIGRCVGIKVIPAVEERVSPKLLVLVVPGAYMAANAPRWMPASAILTEDDARRWVANGF